MKDTFPEKPFSEYVNEIYEYYQLFETERVKT